MSNSIQFILVLQIQTINPILQSILLPSSHKQSLAPRSPFPHRPNEHIALQDFNDIISPPWEFVYTGLYPLTPPP